MPVSIGGSTYVPAIAQEADVKDRIDGILHSGMDAIDKAVELALYCMKTQTFLDGNKRAAIIFANHYLIGEGRGLLVVPETRVSEFKELLVAYYEGRGEALIKAFLKDPCWRRF